MPLPMVHLGVARIFAESVEICEPAQFFLGSIAPDAVHMRAGDYRSEWKLASHLRPSREFSKDSVKRNAVEFIRTHENSAERDFFAGYGVHIITDILWNLSIFEDFKRKYEEDDLPPENRNNVYYNAADRLDFELFHRMPWRSAVWDALAGSHGVDTDGLVSAAEVDGWNRRTLHWYDSGESLHKEPVYFFTYEKLVEFIEYAADETVKLLRKG